MNDIQGDISIQLQEYQDTIDEPVFTTIKREVNGVWQKFGYVIIPSGKSKRLLHDWDLWGPLFITLSLAGTLASSQKTQSTEVFTGVFFILWFGAIVITLNNQLLGGTLSFFQSVCVLGYCILPLVIISGFLRLVAISHVWLRLVFVIIAFTWSILASMGFLANSASSNRKALVVYPIVLFYTVISWLIMNDAPV